MLENYDRYSVFPDKTYRKKVYNLLTDEVENIKICEEIHELFTRRYAMDWSGADTVYDLYLLERNERRSWFPIEVFEAEYPDYVTLVNAESELRWPEGRPNLTDSESSINNETTYSQDDDLPPVPKSLKRARIVVESDQEPIPESPSVESLSDSISDFSDDSTANDRPPHDVLSQTKNSKPIPSSSEKYGLLAVEALFVN